MFVLKDFLGAFAGLADWVLAALIIVIILRVVLSWVNADPFNPIVRAVGVISDPFLKPFRRLFPPWKLGGLDISPILAVVILGFLRQFLVSLLWDIYRRLG